VHGDAGRLDGAEFFLKIDGLLGDSADAKHKGEFNIFSYDFDIKTDAAGHTVISPLTVVLDGSVGSVLTEYVATGHEISAVRLVGRTTGVNPQEVYELRLNGVTITAASDADTFDRLSLDFERMALTTRLQNSAGGVDSESFGFDLKTNAEIDPALVVAPGGGLVHGDVADPMEFFLKIDGVLGDSADAKHKGEFDLEGYNFLVSTDAAGHAVFEPLRLDLEGGLGSVLTGYAATGQLIDAVRLVGRTGGANPQEVYELRLNGVTIDATFDSPASDLLRFDFERVALTTRVQDATGSLVSQSFGFDLKTNEQIDPALVVAPGGGTVHGDVPQAQQFFLKLDDFDGGSTDDKHKGEFEIDSYNFFLSTDAAGQVVFSPLSVDLASGLGSALVQYAATQQPIDALRLVGRTGGATPQEVYELRLTGVTISEVRDGIQTDTLSFDFERLSITTKSLSPGGLLESHIFAYDVLNHQEIDPALVTSPHDAGGLFAAMGMSSPSFDDAMFAAFAGLIRAHPARRASRPGAGAPAITWHGRVRCPTSRSTRCLRPPSITEPFRLVHARRFRVQRRRPGAPPGARSRARAGRPWSDGYGRRHRVHARFLSRAGAVAAAAS
jgi:type VI secretion system secreted protein Hcp